jgi:hypothetical protein
MAPTATVKIEGLEVALKRLRLQDGDVLVARTTQDDTWEIYDGVAALHKALQDAGVHVFTICLAAGITLGSLDQEQMAKAGWVRWPP